MTNQPGNGSSLNSKSNGRKKSSDERINVITALNEEAVRHGAKYNVYMAAVMLVTNHSISLQKQMRDFDNTHRILKSLHEKGEITDADGYNDLIRESVSLANKMTYITKKGKRLISKERKRRVVKIKIVK